MLVAVAACGGGSESDTYKREALAACLQERVKEVDRADDLIEDSAEGGGLDVTFKNGDTATLYFEGTEGQAKTTAAQTKQYADAAFPGAEVDQRGNLVIAYWQETADDSKDAADECL